MIKSVETSRRQDGKRPQRRTCRLLLLLTIAAIPGSVRSQEAPGDPRHLMVAPNAPHAETDLNAPSGGGDKTANICFELQAFLEHAQAGAGPSARSPDQKTDRPADQSTTQTAAAPHDTTDQSGTTTSPAAVQRPPDQPPTVDAPQRSSGLSARIPHDGTTRKTPYVSLHQVRAYVAANDLRACQAAARQMRRAGVAMPNGLLALAALRPDLLQAPSDSR